MCGEIILHYFAAFREIYREIVSNVESYKEEFECSFQIRKLRSRVT